MLVKVQKQNSEATHWRLSTSQNNIRNMSHGWYDVNWFSVLNLIGKFCFQQHVLLFKQFLADPSISCFTDAKMQWCWNIKR